jgi:hypothetical protein
MIGFGFMDNTVMIHAGNAIDMTMGVTFGLSTMTAAACGQVCSDVSGVAFGGVIAAAAERLGLPTPDFTPEQMHLPEVHRVGTLGGMVGVFTGCTLGLSNLYLIDTSQKDIKIAASAEDGKLYTVEVSNDKQEGTFISIQGPPTKYLLPTVLTALMDLDISILSVHSEIYAVSEELGGEWKNRQLLVTKDGGRIDDDELQDLAHTVWLACTSPRKYQQVVVENEELKAEVDRLQRDVSTLNDALELLATKVIGKKSLERCSASPSA